MARPDPYAEAEGRSGMAAPPDTDDEGYLVDPADWSEEVAERLARAEGIELGDLHRRVLRFMRAFFDEHQVAADARFVIRYLAEQEGFGAGARAAVRTVPVRIRQAGLQDRRHAAAARVEHRLRTFERGAPP